MTRFFLVLVFISSPVAAQSGAGSSDSAQRLGEHGWSAGVGVNRVASPLGLGTHINVDRRGNGWSFRLSLDNASNLKETVALRAVALSVGGYVTAGPLDISLHAGPSYSWGKTGFDNAGFALEESFRTGGVNVDLAMLFRVGSRARLGIAAWANSNSRQSAFGVGPRLQFKILQRKPSASGA